MKKLKKSFIVCLILTIITLRVISFKPENACAVQAASSEIVIERDTGEILHERSIDARVSIASLTKIITAITAIENYPLDKEIVITKQMTGFEGSSIYLKEGEILSLEELLYGLMLRSGNDAATAIATGVGGDIKRFAEMMNETAKKAGAENSNFVNPHGLEESNHYSTARDLALITAYALKNPVFSNIVSTRSVKIRDTVGGEDRLLINKNKILKTLDGADGVKTGYTKVSGRCLVSSATRNGIQLICVVINCGPMYERSAELINKCFEKYKLVD